MLNKRLLRRFFFFFLQTKCFIEFKINVFFEGKLVSSKTSNNYVMNFTKVISFVFIATLALTGIKSTCVFKKDEIGTLTYKIGTDSKTVTLRSQSVYYSIDKVGRKDNLKSNSSVVFTVNDMTNGLAFRFSVKDDKVITELDGQYPLRFPGGFNEGEPLRSTSVMIIDTKNGTNTLQSDKGGTCEIFQKGTTLKISIKSAKVITGDSETPFEFALSANKVKVVSKDK
jgi:hypothetical protein